MDYFGGHQLQLLVSFVVIVGVAFVALVCDFLKGNNEQLRELAVELKVRQEHRTTAGSGQVRPDAKKAQVAEAAAAKAGQQQIEAARVEKAAAEKAAAAESLERAVERVKADVAADAEASLAAPKHETRARRAREMEAATAAMDRGSDIVAVRPRRQAVAVPSSAAAELGALDVRAQRKAAMRARMERARAEETAPVVGEVASMHIEAGKPQPVMEAAKPKPAEDLYEKTLELPIFHAAEGPVAMPEPRLSMDQKNLLDEILAATAANGPAPALHRESGRGRTAVRDDLFSSIESRVSKLENKHGGTGSLAGVEFSEAEFVIDPSPAARLQRAIEATQNQPSMAAASRGAERVAELPAGLQDGFVLSKLVQNRKPISGLVVSIGVDGSDRKMGRMPEPVNNLMRSLLGAEDFGCQSGEDEFLLIFPNEQGATAQRKLAAIAERLWDFQLRSMGSFSILFSWGGVEVNGESISEAISSASERMHETQRSRKVAGQPTFVTEPARRMAV